MRGSINRLSSATKRFGVSKKSTLGGSPKKSLAEKKEDLIYLMTDEPKKRSSTGYAISDDLRLKWKQLGPLSVEDIERHLHEWAEEQDADDERPGRHPRDHRYQHEPNESLKDGAGGAASLPSIEYGQDVARERGWIPARERRADSAAL